MEHCPNCGGELKIIVAILEQPVIEKILTHLGFQARALPGASSGLTSPNPDRSGDPATRAAGVGYVRGFSGSFLAGADDGHAGAQRHQRCITAVD